MLRCCLVIGFIPVYNVKHMDKSVTNLRRCDLVAWTELLHHQGQEGIKVTAVTPQPVFKLSGSGQYPHLTRYQLTLANQSDPITFIGKETTRTEARFYHQLAPMLPFLAPKCYFAQIEDQKGWIILDDTPNHLLPAKWTANDVESIIQDVTRLHTIYWEAENKLQDAHWLPHFNGRHQKIFSWAELRHQQKIYFQEGPAALISDHAISSAGLLAPILLEAANGLAVLRSLGGWPGVLSEAHMAAAADLLDDPVPILAPLNELPLTLLHGNLHNYHWHLTLFDERRLFDWRTVSLGPGVCDLINFTEQFDLLYADDSSGYLATRSYQFITEETLIDSYILAMSNRLGPRINTRAVRLAIPAARCLYVLTQWFPSFATWFSQMPNKYTWQRVNRMSDEQLIGSVFEPMIGFRPYLTAVFHRFIQAYRAL